METVVIIVDDYGDNTYDWSGPIVMHDEQIKLKTDNL